LRWVWREAALAASAAAPGLCQQSLQAYAALIKALGGAQ